MQRVVLQGRGEFEEWRDAARALLLAGCPPEAAEWSQQGDAADLFAPVAAVSLPGPVEGAAAPSVPASFIELARTVLCHSDTGRFALLYRLLFRLQSDRQLLAIATDEDVVRARLMEKSVRRDAHKMTAFVRFKEVGRAENGRRSFIAWFEPEHHILGRIADFFRRRFTDMNWLILTPRGSLRWDGQALAISHEPCEKPNFTDDADELWRTYYANIFNPARLKVKAMQAEMPKKYWKNLPEADLIPSLILEAETRVRRMAAQAASQPPVFHERLRQMALAGGEPEAAPAGTFEALAQAASVCTRCPLHAAATQTVFGQGPADAALMFVGEQPGDQEDLAGRPFVGPAGKMFNEALALAGIERSGVYVTNAVKHFKYEPRGKRRIHQKPNMGEIAHCRWWLTQELDLVKPKLVVAMGATALYALTGESRKLGDVRGRPLPLGPDRALYVTVHPSYLLRIPDRGKQAEELQRFREEIASVKRLMAA